MQSQPPGETFHTSTSSSWDSTCSRGQHSATLPPRVRVPGSSWCRDLRVPAGHGGAHQRRTASLSRGGRLAKLPTRLAAEGLGRVPPLEVNAKALQCVQRWPCESQAPGSAPEEMSRIFRNLLTFKARPLDSGHPCDFRRDLWHHRRATRHEWYHAREWHGFELLSSLFTCKGFLEISSK